MLLALEKIKKLLTANVLQHIDRIELLEIIDSTNRYLLSLANTYASPKIRFCLADEQTAGKGRENRQWASPADMNIYLSVLLKLPTKKLHGLSLAIGVITANALQPFCDKPIQLKWPNDLLIGDKKFGGILIETVSLSKEETAVVIGIGLNINAPKTMDNSIMQPWTSLFQETHRLKSRNEIAAALIEQLVNGLIQFKQDGLTGFIEEWNQRDYLRNKSIQVEMPTDTLSGMASGIDSTGALLLKTETGKVISIQNAKKINII